MGFYEEEFEEYVTPSDVEFGYYANSFWGDDDSYDETEPMGQNLDIQD